MAKITKLDKKELLFFPLILLQLIALFIFNFFRLKNQADYDSSSGMIQVMEIWKQKTLLIKNWEYQTSAGWDVPLIFSVLLYGITKNIYFSIGTVNNIFIILLVYLVYDILKRTNVSRLSRLITISLFLTPYTFDQLGYLPMLFVGAASYSMKLSIILLLVDLIIRADNNIKIKKSIGLFILLCLFSLLCGISSGLYIYICGVIPIIIYYILNSIIKDSFKTLIKHSSIYILSATICFIIGIIAASFLALTNNSSTMTIIPAKEFGTNIVYCFGAIFELYGATTSAISPQVISIAGITSLCCFLIVFLLLFVVLYYTIQTLKKKETRPLVHIILCLFYINELILIIAKTTYSSDTFEYRYQLIPTVPLFILVGIFINDIIKRLNNLSVKSILVILFAAGTLISAYNYTYYYKTTSTSRIDELQAIVDVAKENDINLISYISYDPLLLTDGRLLRLCDSNVNVATFKTHDFSVGWGGITKYFECGYHKDKIMVVVPDEKVSSIPAFISGQLKEVNKLLGYTIYIAQHNILDCKSDIKNRKNIEFIDYPYTTGYISFSDIDENGDLNAPDEGGLILSGPNMVCEPGAYDITLNYKDGTNSTVNSNSSNDKIGEFHITDCNGNVIKNMDIISGETNIVIPSFSVTSETPPLHYEIIANPNSKLKIHSISAKAVD